MVLVIESQQAQKKPGKGPGHELARLLRRILMTVVREHISKRLAAIVVINLHLETRS